MKIKFYIAQPFHLFSLVKYFFQLNNDVVTRKYYRYLPCRNLIEIIYCFFFLFCRITLNKFFYIFFHRYYILVFIHDSLRNKIIGICHIDVYLDHFTNEYIGYYGISILKEWQHKGFGKILSMAAMRIARNLNVRTIKLHVDKDNVHALKFYKKLGFQIKKYSPFCDYGYYDKNPIDCFLMEKKL